MRIGVDARELGGRATGVGRYLAGLLREWSRDGSARRHDFTLYASGSSAPLDGGETFDRRVVDRTAGTWWEQFRLPRIAAEDRLDVFFSPAYTAPIRIGVPIVVTIHDLSYMAHPEWFPLREGVRRRWLTKRTAAVARAIITVSAFSKREILERLGGVDADRVHVIAHGIDRPAVEGSTERDPRVLYVGSIFNRRHVPDLIRAVAACSRGRPDVSLDIVGDNRTYPYEDLEQVVASVHAADRVRWHRYVTDEQLHGLYGRARAFAFLSEYEGFGLTPLEALAAGSVPVVADTPVAREICGEAALFVPVGDVPAATHALEAALFDSTTRRRILEAAEATLAKYEWPRAACETLAVIEAAAT